MRIGHFETESNVLFTCTVFQLASHKYTYSVYMLYSEAPNPHAVTDEND